jgi:hypothetical protein
VLPVYIAQLQQRIAALRSHQQRILGAVLLDEDVGGAVDVRGMKSSIRALFFNFIARKLALGAAKSTRRERERSLRRRC